MQLEPPTPDVSTDRPLRTLGLRARLTITFVLVAALTAALVSVAGILTSRQALIDVVGSNLNTLSADQAALIESFIEQQITALHVLSVGQGLVSSAEIANLQYSSSQSSVRSQLARQEQEWQAAPADSTFVQSRITGAPALVNLGWFQSLQPDNIQVLLADKQGGLVAATARPNHFDSSGEAWWQAASAGETYLDQVEDPDSGAVRLRIAVPVINLSSNTVVGALQTTFRLDPLIAQLAAVHVGASGGAVLQIGEDQILGEAGRPRPADTDAIDALHASGEAYRIGQFAGRQRVISLTSIGADPAVARLNWDLIIFQDEGEALAPVNAARNVGLLAALGAMLIAGILAFLVAGLIARPLAQMAAAAQAITAGQLDRRVGLSRGDEIGVLARSFDLMAASLEQRIASEQHAQQERLQLQEEVIRVQAATLRELATPFIPLGNQVLLLPLIGSIDEQRAEQIFAALLREVSARRARRVIIDVTGIPGVDTRVAATLMQATAGVRLLGAEVMLTGIRAGLAQTLVELDLPLDQITIVANLDAALAADV